MTARVGLSIAKVATCPECNAGFLPLMQQLANDLWVIRHPLSLLGGELGRTVTIIRIDGKLLIHSTAAFNKEEVAALHALGTPNWMLDATLMHDTCARAGRAALPEATYHAPKGFPVIQDSPPLPLLPPPPEWAGRVEVIELRGAPMMSEHVFFHRPSRTLVLADLIFNLPANASPWTRFLARTASGLKAGTPGVSRLVKMSIRDRKAFGESVQQVLAWDFDRVIVGHGEMIERDGKSILTSVLSTFAK